MRDRKNAFGNYLDMVENDTIIATTEETIQNQVGFFPKYLGHQGGLTSVMNFL